MFALLTALALLQPPPPAVTITPESDRVRTEPHRQTVLRVKTNGAGVKWVFVDDGLNPLDQKLLRDATMAVICPSKAGAFRVLCYTADANGPSEPCWILVEVGSPSPFPPVPPNPVPPAPLPSDPFALEIQALYTADASPDKAACLTKLKGIYAVAGVAAVNDPAIATGAAITERLRLAIKALGVPDDCLKALRTRIAQEGATKFTTNDVPLTPETRAAIGGHYARMAQALEAVR